MIAKTDPPLMSVVAKPVARRNGARLVNWLQDIYPETAVELGVPFMRGPVAASLAALRNATLREAAATVVVGDLMGRKVEALGAPAERIHVIANWCNDEDIALRRRTTRCGGSGIWPTNSCWAIRAIWAGRTSLQPCWPPRSGCATSRAWRS